MFFLQVNQVVGFYEKDVMNNQILYKSSNIFYFESFLKKCGDNIYYIKSFFYGICNFKYVLWCVVCDFYQGVIDFE